MERPKNKKVLYKSNFIFPENLKTLPPIRLKISDCSKEIYDDLNTLKDEKLLSSNTINNNQTPNKIFKDYHKRRFVLKPNFSQTVRTKSTFENTNKSINFNKDPMKLRIKKIRKENKIAQSTDFTNSKLSLISSNFDSIKVDKKDILNQLNELDESSNLTNKILIKRNEEHNELVFKYIKRRLRRDKRMLFITDEFLQPERVKPFEIPTKKNAFFSNLDHIIDRIKETSLSSDVIFKNLKNLNIKGHDKYKRQKEIEIQEKGFKKFDNIVAYGDNLKKDFNYIIKKYKIN